MKTIRINTSSKTYDIKLGKDILKDSGKLISETGFKGKICVITDENVQKLYLKELTRSLKNSGFCVFEIIINAGEKYKNMDTVLSIYDLLCKYEISRKDMLVAFGGGVVGDITGFAAATYLRGIKYIQIPTTLLSQVDSSVGGKTGVDLKCGKNLVGAFKQPELVIADINLLKTLPDEQISSGMAEIIKAGFIKDEVLINLLLSSVNLNDDIEEFILRAINVKKKIVEEDEFEGHLRMLLNFGHTFGHAIEKYMNFDKITHGDAVAVGMCLITKNDEVLEILQKILKKYNLPTSIDIPVKELIRQAKNDKKTDSNGINIVVVNKIGEGEIIKLSFERFGEIYE